MWISYLPDSFSASVPVGITEREARQHARFYIEDVLGDKTVSDRELTLEEQQRLQRDLQRYSSGEPIQYITGISHFYKLKLFVNEHVLIPRQETEELVHMLLKDHPEPYARVLDIGTGSGCVAIALQHNRPVWYVQAMDVSENALGVARKNASLNKVDVDFLQSDILLDEIEAPVPFDIIVSNPPYIPHKEAGKVGSSTLNFEPGIALWAPDDDPLLFYRVIAEKSQKALKPGGQLYFEINEFHAEAVAKVLYQLGYTDIRVFDDLQDKPRMIKCANV